MVGILALQVVKISAVLAVATFTGVLVRERGLRVNYARKINHFVLFLLPIALDRLLVLDKSVAAFIASAFGTLSLLVLFTRPIRRRVRWLDTAFLSLDRPEDRPYTLVWLTTQLLAGYVVIAPAIVIFHGAGIADLLFIPLLINGIGDGLAEPIGVRFGRHRYRVRALFSKRRFDRSIEGSACVFLTSVIVLAVHAPLLSTGQYWLAIAIIPLAMTLAEAWSPHTWDTPFLFLVGYLLLGLIAAL